MGEWESGRMRDGDKRANKSFLKMFMVRSFKVGREVG